MSSFPRGTISQPNILLFANAPHPAPTTDQLTLTFAYPVDVSMAFDIQAESISTAARDFFKFTMPCGSKTQMPSVEDRYRTSQEKGEQLNRQLLELTEALRLFRMIEENEKAITKELESRLARAELECDLSYSSQFSFDGRDTLCSWREGKILDDVIDVFGVDIKDLTSIPKILSRKS